MVILDHYTTRPRPLPSPLMTEIAIDDVPPTSVVADVHQSPIPMKNYDPDVFPTFRKFPEPALPFFHFLAQTNRYENQSSQLLDFDFPPDSPPCVVSSPGPVFHP
jgi:hypothetical protein